MKIQIIIGSTRPGRVSDRVGKWVEKAAAENKLEGFEIVDLSDYDLPLFDEAISPKYNPNRTPNDNAKKWLDKLSEADAYVFVTPEYNHSISGALKNALDYIDYQLTRKPAAVVSHGSVGGARAAEHLKAILLEVGTVVIPPAVAFVGMLAMNPTIEENGDIQQDVKDQPYGPQTALVNALNELVWYAEALKTARSKN
jgi:NAD(P)H-dependent FMN reductase